MKKMRASVFVLLSGLMVFGAGPAYSRTEDRAPHDFERNDLDGDGKLSRAEWLRRGNFDRLDVNGDGFLSLSEVRVHYGVPKTKTPLAIPVKRGKGAGKDKSLRKARVKKGALGKQVLCGVLRAKKCPPSAPIKRGLIATGLGPEFPKGAKCIGVDDYFAMDYGFKRRREAYHGGTDLPAPFGTPMIAAAAGTVVGVYRGRKSARGAEIILRHSPEDTGLGLWIYTQYGHLDEMPDLDVGDRVVMGEYLGPTGNSGVSGRTGKQSSKRRPAIHFAAWYSTSEKYAEVKDIIVPMDAWWMDPTALYRKKLPVDSKSMKALPESEKGVPISVMFTDGSAYPADTKVVWPYPCERD